MHLLQARDTKGRLSRNCEMKNLQNGKFGS